jgi:hypothetical protein
MRVKLQSMVFTSGGFSFVASVTCELHPVVHYLPCFFSRQDSFNRQYFGTIIYSCWL